MNFDALNALLWKEAALFRVCNREISSSSETGLFVLKTTNSCTSTGPPLAAVISVTPALKTLWGYRHAPLARGLLQI